MVWHGFGGTGVGSGQSEEGNVRGGRTGSIRTDEAQKKGKTMFLCFWEPNETRDATSRMQGARKR